MNPSRLPAVLALLALLAGCGERRVGGTASLGLTPSGAPILAVAGTPYEMGFWQGRLLAERIASLNARWQAAALGGGEGEALREACALYADQVRRRLPEAVRQELEGLADGSGVALGSLLLTEMLSDGLRFHEEAPRLTGLLACAGEPLEARCVPSGPDAGILGGELLLVERRPAGGRATLLVAWPGSLGGLGGVAEGGCGLLAVPVPAPAEHQSLAGAPFTLLVRSALEEAEDAAGLLARLGGATAWRVLALDGPEGTRLLGTAALASSVTADLSALPHFALPPEARAGEVTIPAAGDPEARRAFEGALGGGWRISWTAAGWRASLGPGDGVLLPLAPRP